MDVEMDDSTQKWINMAIQDHLRGDGPGPPLVCICGICGDRATGKHYGAMSCDGCKGFFRRSVRNNSIYVCRFQRRCEVDRDKRNQCRYCRLKKCFTVGMKISAVQNERDKIRKAKDVNDEPAQQKGLGVRFLRMAELAARNACAPVDDGKSKSNKTVTLKDLHKTMMSLMHNLVAWIKLVPVFSTLSSVDQITLIRSNVVPNLILTAVRKSLTYEDVLEFSSGCFLKLSNGHKKSKRVDEELLQLGAQIMREVVHPFVLAELDDGDFACLRAIVFFNPAADNLIEEDVVRRVRSQIQASLNEYLLDRQYDVRGRFGELLLTLPSLHEVALRMTMCFVEANLYDAAEIEKTAKRMLMDPNVQVTSLVTYNVNKDDDSNDSSATASSPNSPTNLLEGNVEHITVKIEPEEYSDSS